MKIISAFFVFCCTAVLPVVMTSSADASDVKPFVPKTSATTLADPVQSFQNAQFADCLSDAPGNVLMDNDAPCHPVNYPSERWYVHHWNDGTVQLRNYATGGCIDDSGTYGLRTLGTCWPGSDSRSVYQSFHVTHVGANVVFRNQATSRCIDDGNRWTPAAAGCTSAARQQWG